MKRGDAFKSTYLAKNDVTRPLVLTIADVKLETVGQGSDAEEKAVAHFVGDAKPMVLNLYNWAVCEEAYGNDSEFWRGKSVEVYVDPAVMFGGKKVGGLRLRMPSTNGAVAGPAWTLDECVKRCADVGITRDEMISTLKARGAGHAGFNSARDTPAVQEMIAVKSGTGQGSMGYDEQIPFKRALSVAA